MSRCGPAAEQLVTAPSRVKLVGREWTQVLLVEGAKHAVLKPLFDARLVKHRLAARQL